MNIDLTKTQQYLEWLKNKLYLNAIATSAKNRIVYRGQVYRCNLGVGIGSEECKERPCVVLQYNSANRTSPNTLVTPLTFLLLYRLRRKKIPPANSYLTEMLFWEILHA